MEWTRRRFLNAVGTALAAVVGVWRPAAAAGPTAATRGTATARPTPPAADRPGLGGDPVASARDDLRRLVVSRALALDDPWVLMHALLPLGRDARRVGGEAILDLVTRTWVEPVAVAGKTYPRFPLNVEAHPNHFLEVMYATGVPSTRRFETRAGAITRADLYAGAKALFSPALPGDELAWTVSIFAAEMPPDRDRFETAEGRSFSVAAVVEAAAQAAEATYRDTIAALRGSKPYGRSAVQDSACNGTHAIFGLLDALRHGYRANGLPERVALLMRAQVFRLTRETALIDQAIGAGGAPNARLNADAAKLQFLGHALENVRFAARHRLYEYPASERATIADAERELAAIARRLVTLHDLDGLARAVPRAYRVILGDACHALHGLQEAAG